MVAHEHTRRIQSVCQFWSWYYQHSGAFGNDQTMTIVQVIPTAMACTSAGRPLSSRMQGLHDSGEPVALRNSNLVRVLITLKFRQNSLVITAWLYHHHTHMTSHSDICLRAAFTAQHDAHEHRYGALWPDSMHCVLCSKNVRFFGPSVFAKRSEMAWSSLIINYTHNQRYITTCIARGTYQAYAKKWYNKIVSCQ